MNSNGLLLSYKDNNQTNSKKYFGIGKLSQENINIVDDYLYDFSMTNKIIEVERGHALVVFITLYRNENVIEYSIATDQNKRVVDFVKLIEELTKKIKPIFTNFMYAEGPPLP